MSQELVKALLFDKDGTLFDFQATWGAWAGQLITDLTGSDAALGQRLADAMQFDAASAAFHPDSPMIAASNRECAQIVAGALPSASVDDIEAHMIRSASVAPLAPSVPLAPFLDHLAAQGYVLGVMTNDAEMVAHAHLRNAGVADRFAFIAGYDSGYGAKPDPGPLLAFADATKTDPAHVAMVGDSTHDLIAGRAAGMRTIGVLSGPASAATLTPHADVVLPDIGHIPAWLAS
ncbi:MAG: HAD family hydrolase [Roseovarius sp.]